VQCPDESDWARVERELDVRLPADFKALVSLVGTGTFGQGLVLWSPVTSWPLCRLSLENLLSFREQCEFMEPVIGDHFYPEPGGLLKVGGFERMQLFLRIDVGPGEAEFLVVDFEYDELRPIGCSLSEFVWSMYEGTLKDEWAREFGRYVFRPQYGFFTPVETAGTSRVQPPATSNAGIREEGRPKIDDRWSGGESGGDDASSVRQAVRSYIAAMHAWKIDTDERYGTSERAAGDCMLSMLERVERLEQFMASGGLDASKAAWHRVVSEHCTPRERHLSRGPGSETVHHRELEEIVRVDLPGDGQASVWTEFRDEDGGVLRRRYALLRSEGVWLIDQHYRMADGVEMAEI
jgi:hypothetical protein